MSSRINTTLHVRDFLGKEPGKIAFHGANIRESLLCPFHVRYSPDMTRIEGVELGTKTGRHIVDGYIAFSPSSLYLFYSPQPPMHMVDGNGITTFMTETRSAVIQAYLRFNSYARVLFEQPYMNAAVWVGTYDDVHRCADTLENEGLPTAKRQISANEAYAVIRHQILVMIEDNQFTLPDDVGSSFLLLPSLSPGNEKRVETLDLYVGIEDPADGQWDLDPQGKLTQWKIGTFLSLTAHHKVIANHAWKLCDIEPVDPSTSSQTSGD